jgi:hypothetical protein
MPHYIGHGLGEETVPELSVGVENDYGGDRIEGLGGEGYIEGFAGVG